jgi:hypothetical protein
MISANGLGFMTPVSEGRLAAREEFLLKQTLFAILFLSAPFQAQSINSGTVSSYSAAATAVPSATNWRVISGGGDIVVPATDANGAVTAQITVNTQPDSVGFMVEYRFPVTMDLRAYDTVSFLAQTSQTHIGDFMYLVDTKSRMRWFNLILRSSLGIQTPVYSINNFAGEHSGFDVSSVAAIRYGQYAMSPGDVLNFGTPIFETGILDHCDVASSWFLDLVSSGNIITSPDSVNGSKSILANLVANNEGQADIAILGTAMDIRWDLSKKQYVSFYFKDQNTTSIHYFLIYDKSRNYREWLFANSDPGNWIKVTGDLQDSAYYESGPIDLSNVEQFEVGIFGGPPQGVYTFQVDEVTVR